ncbi:MAG: hypothetical protein N3D77_16200, partial [Geminicoccaceae bacterium]|nr:hypothetical protein [Geminicoccaceae bacterium]
AYNHPLIFLLCLLLFVLLALWLIRVLWKFVARLVRRLVAIFSGAPDPLRTSAQPDTPSAGAGAPTSADAPPPATPNQAPGVTGAGERSAAGASPPWSALP